MKHGKPPGAPASTGGERGVFVDRDGTIIRERTYLSDPAGVELLPGAAEGLRRLADAGFAIVVVTNQSGIARGFYDEAAYRAVERRVAGLLREQGVELAGSYHCPHHPDFTGPCACRKPGAGLFRRAASELGLDLRASVYVGDRLRDVEPGLGLGGRAFLVRTGYGAAEAAAAPAGVSVVDDLQAVARALSGSPEAVDTPRDDR